MVNQAIVSIDVTIATQYSVFIWIDRKVQDINRNRRIYRNCPYQQFALQRIGNRLFFIREFRFFLS